MSNSKKSHGGFNRNAAFSLALIALIVLAVVLFAGSNLGWNATAKTQVSEAESPQASREIVASVDDAGGIVIEKSDITEDALFVSYDADGMAMGVLAVRASDGSIRTAWNTCQVCNGSPAAYFVQEGDVLVCRNCGNQFTMDQVGMTSAGCDPVPISGSARIETDAQILIPIETIEANKGLFTNWKQA
ncbi:MAG: DUF2318 domain-containing protein [Actinobacteria bacterium]|nr:DUF2318 domain-containing protein [Actinomycetota bacterium]